MPSAFDTSAIDKSNITEAQKVGALIGELESMLAASASCSSSAA